MRKHREIVVIAHNLRSTHNVGSLLRTAEGLGIAKVYLTGYTPYPKLAKDQRLPYIADKLHKQISKTALGAEDLVEWAQADNALAVIDQLKSEDFQVYALEQTAKSVKLPDFTPPEKIAIVLGREVEGIEPEVLSACDGTLEIPMFGKKESFNVVQAAAMSLYHTTFAPH
jgi:23S rRNA (guanosine2251-2'-O)-methyltransferase